MAELERYSHEVAGVVQGVGFRPFVHRLAGRLDLTGWARNSLTGLTIEIEGAPEACAKFLDEISNRPPPHAVVREVTSTPVPVTGESGFSILHSETELTGAATEILPDLATCTECLREIFDPGNRRFHYPFTNCIHCGPRFSIVHSLPWDRERTTMSGFEMCPACRSEFNSPDDRRFHAQPNACPECGPQLSFTDADGHVLAHRGEALEQATRSLEAGHIIALKGIGGFQLLADARSPDAIESLRTRKHRPAKPFALMLPDLESVRRYCQLDSLTEELLQSPQAPIVLLERRSDSELPAALAPGNPMLGVMLPYSPLHHLLLRRLSFPVVATSGNLSQEPLCIENDEAFQRLHGIADGFLVHDRPIARPVDDSVVRPAAGRPLILRSARGYAPCSLGSPRPPVLAVGGDQKTALAVTGPFGIRCAQHLGDLETEAAQDAFTRQARDFPALCGVQPTAIACDLHPDYHGTRLAGELGLPVIQVQHHHAHIAACLAEHDVTEEVLGVAWDGTGYGTDGVIWGGEFLIASQSIFRRVAHLRSFPLPGGELAIRQPRYAALGLLHEAGIPVTETALANSFAEEELTIAHTQLDRSLHCPSTTSAGRLIDAVAALLGIRERNEFEAQAAMDLEFAASTTSSNPDPLPMPTDKDGTINWEPMVRTILDEKKKGQPVPDLAQHFLATLSQTIVEVASREGKHLVVLSGGCFQNAPLLETTIARLLEAGFTPLWSRQAPPNDGGLALGQAVVATAQLKPSAP